MLVHRAAVALTAVTLTAAALSASSAMAQPAAAPSAQDFVLPHAFAGYSEPEITQCATAGPTRRSCQVPAMTAGHYLIVAMAGASATGDKATQSLAIKLDGRACAAANPVAFTGKRGMRIGCAVQFLTDKPIVVSAEYAVTDGTPDPAGPQLVFRRLPWLGFIDAQPEIIQTPRPAAAPAAKSGK